MIGCSGGSALGKDPWNSSRNWRITESNGVQGHPAPISLTLDTPTPAAASYVHDLPADEATVCYRGRAECALSWMGTA